jgi:D-beta-D-heptose 7-phosphate kinase/D-beta-D-heptose 1-phosphate adenosyltransferase
VEYQSLNFNNARILVIGDVMLDQYWHGGTSRISPEAPVPIVHVNRWDERPGGAANVALGIAALGAKPHLLGIIGEDEAGVILEKLLSQYAVKHQLSKISNGSTITKLRIISRNQQMIRLDKEKVFPHEFNISLSEHYQTALKNIDLVILSDYGKGTLFNASDWIRKAREKNVPVIVDPKSQDFSIYTGASIITPNLKEFEAVVGPCATIDILVEKAHQLLKQHQIGALVVTRSEQGISVITENGQAIHIPAVARAVHDVTGAGDTVVAVLAVALASGIDLVKAATLGNLAAGIVVGKLGAETVSVAELESTLEKAETLPMGVMDEETLLAAIRISKLRGERIVFTNGCFDILHAGHVMYLEQAKQLGDRVIVAVNSDASVSRLKGPERPINSTEDRMAVLAGLKSVDWVIPFTEDTPERVIRRISPHVLVKGGDYKDVQAIPGAQYVLSQGGEVQLLGLKEGVSTTRVINIINQKSEATTETVA